MALDSTPPRLVNGQLVSLPPVGILNLLYLICIIFVTRIWSYSHGICAIKMFIIIIIFIRPTADIIKLRRNSWFIMFASLTCPLDSPLDTRVLASRCPVEQLIPLLSYTFPLFLSNYPEYWKTNHVSHTWNTSMTAKLVSNYISWFQKISWPSPLRELEIPQGIEGNRATASCVAVLFLPCIDVVCDLLLNRHTATRNLLLNGSHKPECSSRPFLAPVVHSCPCSVPY